MERMHATQPTLADLIDALPAGADEAPRDGASEIPAALLAELAQRPVPTGRLTRLWSLGTLQAKIAAAYLAWWLRSGLQDASARRRGLDEAHLAAAIQVVGRMSYLRGAVMKLGQVLAHWPDVLPIEFAAVLGRLHAEAPPMHFSLLREHVRRELGADPTELFAEFETQACAAASLGQVHRARLKGSGRPVAVKIQYPDIARTIQDDLRNLKAAAFGMRLSGDWENLLAQFDGIRAMLEAEADYEQEAENLRLARRTLSGLEDVVVPRVVPELSTRRVLTMDWVDGVHLDAFLASDPPQELRDRHGAQIARTSMRLWYRARTVYADPHPGNYLFLADGRLGLIDLGCCYRFDEDEFRYVLETERAALAGDERAIEAAILFGCDLDDPRTVEPERLRKMREYCAWVWEPLLSDEPFDYRDPAQFAPGVRLYGEFTKRRWIRSLPVNVWLTRVFFGVRAMLTHLGARVPYGRIMREESPL